jgi:pimeloyl-ACP methyl ester carboxylesterase
VLAAAVVVAVLVGASVASPSTARPAKRVKTVVIHYRAHDGTRRKAYVLLPAWYGPKDDPAIPLIVSPHGRGVSARVNARLWGGLPAAGAFAVVSPEGEGRKLSRYSWGSLGQVDDLARMPVTVHLALPWLHVDRTRVYAVGGSMGGQEALLLLGRYPTRFAGVAAFDSVTDLALQYRSFPRIPCSKRCRKTWNGPIGRSLQSLARQEIGGSPAARPLAYAERSPMTYVRTIAASCVPLQLWWSVKDQIVIDQAHQSGALFREITHLNPDAPVVAFVGSWRHSAEMHMRLPVALATFGLVPEPPTRASSGMHVYAPSDLTGCGPG